jgi:hypothetical protein
VRTVVDSQGTAWALEEAPPGGRLGELTGPSEAAKATLVRCTAGDRKVLIVVPRDRWRIMSDEELLRSIAAAEQWGWRPER